MGKAFDQVMKIAYNFEKKLQKYAENPVVDQGDNDLVVWMNANFDQNAKNKIASDIANAIEEDMNSLLVHLSVVNGKLMVDALVNGVLNDTAKKIVSGVVVPKIASALPKIANGSKYNGWIKYPK